MKIPHRVARFALVLSVPLGACKGAGSIEPPEPPGEAITYSFEKFDVGAPPPSFEAGAAPSGAAGWSIAESPQAPSGKRVLAWTGAASAPGHPTLAWIRDARFGELTLRIRARAAAGSPSVAFGAAWRVRDASSFRALRVSSTEGRLILETVENGTARALASWPFAPEPGRWYALTVEQAGRRIRCGVDQQVLIDALDSEPAQSGAVGVWAMDAASAEFDDLTVVGR